MDEPADMPPDPPAAPVQESLFGPLATGGDMATPPDSLEPVRRDGPGRPPGSVNKRTRQYGDLIVSRYGSPLEVMAQIYAAPLKELRRELQCSLAEAAALRLQAAKDAAPYIHEKRPVAIHHDGRIGHLVIATGLPPGSADDVHALTGEPIPLSDDSEENQ